VTSRLRYVKEHDGEVNNLNPFSPGEVKTKQIWRPGLITLTILLFLARQQKKGLRAHHFKPNLNTSYLMMAANALFLSF